MADSVQARNLHSEVKEDLKEQLESQIAEHLTKIRDRDFVEPKIGSPRRLSESPKRVRVGRNGETDGQLPSTPPATSILALGRHPLHPYLNHHSTQKQNHIASSTDQSPASAPQSSSHQHQHEGNRFSVGDMRQSLEQQILEHRSKSRNKNFVEPKIGGQVALSLPSEPPPPPTIPMPQRSPGDRPIAISNSKRDGEAQTQALQQPEQMLSGTRLAVSPTPFHASIAASDGPRPYSTMLASSIGVSSLAPKSYQQQQVVDDGGLAVEAARRSADLRTALELQVEEKKRRRQLEKERQLMESRERLAAIAGNGSGSSPQAGVMFNARRSPTRQQMEYLGSGKDNVSPARMPPPAAAAQHEPPPSWMRSEFLQLGKREEEEKARRQQVQQRNEQLRLALEEQIREKERAKQEAAEHEARSQAEYDAKLRREQEAAARADRGKAEETTRNAASVARENKMLRDMKAEQQQQPPTGLTRKSLAVTSTRLEPSPSTAAPDDGGDGDAIPSFLRHEQLAPLQPTILSLGASPSGRGGRGAYELEGVREMLNSIQNELRRQRQDLLSPSMFSAIGNQQNVMLPPLINRSAPRQLIFSPSPSPMTAARSPSPSFFANQPQASILPHSNQFVYSTHLRIPQQLSAGGAVHAGGAPGGDLYNKPMPSSSVTVGHRRSPSPAQLPLGDMIADPISDVLRRNQHRVKMLRFGHHHEDILRAFLDQDSPAALDGFHRLHASSDLPITAPPLGFERTLSSTGGVSRMSTHQLRQQSSDAPPWSDQPSSSP